MASAEDYLLNVGRNAPPARAGRIFELLRASGPQFTRTMRLIGWLLFSVILATAGCSTSKTTAGRTKPAESKTIVTPGDGLTGRVSLVNKSSRYTIVSFPVGRLPASGQLLAIYRNGLKVGEVKVNGPQMDNLVTADLVTGDCRVGDEARLQ